MWLAGMSTARKYCCLIEGILHAVDQKLGAVHLQALGLGVEIEIHVVQAVKLRLGAAGLDGVELLVGELVGLGVLLGAR